MEDVVVAGGAEVFGVDSSWFLASLAFLDFGFPFEFFVAGVAEAFGVVFFFFGAVGAFLDHDLKRRSYIIKFVQTGVFRSFCYGRTAYNVYCANSCGDRTI